MITICFGYGAAFPSAVSLELKQYYTEEQISWIVTGPMVSGLFGAMIYSQITPRIGPKKAALVSGVPMVISSCLQLNIANYWCLIAGRVLGGLAAAGIITAVPHYITEIAEDSLRGIMGFIMGLVINSGTLLAYGLGGFLSGFYMSVVSAIVPVVFMVVFFPCPESPIYLLSKGRTDHGTHILRRLRYPRDISVELASINSQTEAQKARWADLFQRRAARKALGITLTLCSITQISGIVPVLSYVGDIFRMAGGSVDALTGSCIVGVAQIVGTLIAMVLIERAGRRALMLFSCIAMAISHGFLGYALMPGSNTPGWFPVTFLTIFIITYTVGTDSVPYIVMNELASPSMRPMTANIGNFYTGILVFLTTKSFSNLIPLMGINGIFWMYGTGCALGAVFVFFMLPETTGRSNASIQEELEGKKVKQIV